MPTQILHRRANESSHQSFTGGTGEWTFITDNKFLAVHDSATVGGFILPKMAANVRTFTSGAIIFADTTTTLNNSVNLTFTGGNLLTIAGGITFTGAQTIQTSTGTLSIQSTGNTVFALTSGTVGIGIVATAVLHLKAGTASANTAPLKLTSGTLNTTAEAGAIEFLTDAFYGTITTAAARKTFAFLESPVFTGNIGMGLSGQTDSVLIVNDITTGTPTFRRTQRWRAAYGENIVLGQSVTIAYFAAGGGLSFCTSSDLGVNDTSVPTNVRLAISSAGIVQITGNQVQITTAQTPASAAAAGTIGTVCWDTGFIYVCTATNTWKKVAIATW